jgi:exopolysaccharide biosynthesis protein
MPPRRGLRSPLLRIVVFCAASLRVSILRALVVRTLAFRALRISRVRRSVLIVLCCVVAGVVLGVENAPSRSVDATARTGQRKSAGLPLGESDLPETRTTRQIVPGLTVTTIVRGSTPAVSREIGTTARGPWRVSVLTLDPRQSQVRLEAGFGRELAKTETTTGLVRAAGALAGVNASFFAFKDSKKYAGDPVGLAIYRGQVLSQPSGQPFEIDFLVDSRANRVVRMDHLRWSGTVRHRETGTQLRLEFVNHPPVVPTACAGKTDQTKCSRPGDISLFTPEFTTRTPSGPGAELLLDAKNCVIRRSATRGVKLEAGQSSLQATGSRSAALLKVGKGCFTRTSVLMDSSGKRIPLNSGLFGVSGRYRLLEDGKVVVPGHTSSFFGRHPRTVVGLAQDGVIKLVTIDGRRTTSVGATLRESAEVLRALGAHDAMNLDGGGSTAMVVGSRLVNRPSGAEERKVSDALVLVRR